MTREDRRSMAYHHAVARALLADPEPILERAHRNLDKLTALHPHAGALFECWRKWLALPPAALAERLATATDQTTLDMRQVSPLSGVLSARERRRVLLEFRSGEGG